MSQITTEQIDSLRELAETLTGKRLGNVKDPIKLQAMIDIARAESAESTNVNTPAQVAQSLAQKRERMREEHLKLVRVVLTAMSPFEKQLKGTMITVGNKTLGNVTRYIPFDVEWHVEKMVLDTLRDRKFRHRVEHKDRVTGRVSYSNRFLPAYAINELEPLTEQERKELCRAMKAREYTEGDM